MPHLNLSDVKFILPQREPMLMVDSVKDFKPGEFADAEKFISPEMEIFSGHFPGNPVLPGVYIIEAMAQCADIFLLTMEENRGKTPYFLGVKNVRFLRPAVPGDTLEISAALASDAGGGMYDCSCTVYLNGRKSALGQVSLALK